MKAALNEIIDILTAAFFIFGMVCLAIICPWTFPLGVLVAVFLTVEPSKWEDKGI